MNETRSTLLTTHDIATRLGIDPSRVRRLAARYGIGERIGARLLVFTEADVARFREHSTGTRGRPPGRKQNSGQTEA